MARRAEEAERRLKPATILWEQISAALTRASDNGRTVSGTSAGADKDKLATVPPNTPQAAQRGYLQKQEPILISDLFLN